MVHCCIRPLCDFHWHEHECNWLTADGLKFQNLQRWNSNASLASDGTGFRRRSRSAGSSRGFRFQRGDFANRRSFRRQMPREEISRDKLDAELDAYMSGTQNVIDVDADAWEDRRRSSGVLKPDLVSPPVDNLKKNFELNLLKILHMKIFVLTIFLDKTVYFFWYTSNRNLSLRSTANRCKWREDSYQCLKRMP